MGLIGGVLQPLYVGARVHPDVARRIPAKAGALASGHLTLPRHDERRPQLRLRAVRAQDWPAEQRAALDLSSWSVAFNGAEPVRAETLEQIRGGFRAVWFPPRSVLPLLRAGRSDADGFGRASRLARAGRRERLAPTRSRRIVGRQGRRRRRRRPRAGRLRRRRCSSSRSLIVNPETLDHCAPDEVGEIWVAGASVAARLLEPPGRDRAHFKAQLADTGEGPFLRTGDLGFLSGRRTVRHGPSQRSDHHSRAQPSTRRTSS